MYAPGGLGCCAFYGGTVIPLMFINLFLLILSLCVCVGGGGGSRVNCFVVCFLVSFIV